MKVLSILTLSFIFLAFMMTLAEVDETLLGSMALASWGLAVALAIVGLRNNKS